MSTPGDYYRRKAERAAYLDKRRRRLNVDLLMARSRCDAATVDRLTAELRRVEADLERARYVGD